MKLRVITSLFIFSWFRWYFYQILCLNCEHFQHSLTLFVMGGTNRVVIFFYHINLNNSINLTLSDFKFYRFINILAEFGRSSPGQFAARTFLSEKFSKFFVLWSLKVFLLIVCILVYTYYLKVVCTHFFRYLF